MTLEDCAKLKAGDWVIIRSKHHSRNGMQTTVTDPKPKGAFVACAGREASEEFFLAGELELSTPPRGSIRDGVDLPLDDDGLLRYLPRGARTMKTYAIRLKTTATRIILANAESFEDAVELAAKQGWNVEQCTGNAVSESSAQVLAASPTLVADLR